MSPQSHRSALLKQEKLKKLLASFEKALIAYSGGVDSTYLLYLAKQALGKESVLAVIARSFTYPKDEVKFAVEQSKKLRVRYQLINTDEFSQIKFLNNDRNRCYYCKKELFTKLKELAQKEKIKYILDGSNFDDLKDYRPGSRARKELGVQSPLQEVRLTKKEIRWLSKRAGLSTWNKPAFACLASRVPYGMKITPEIILRIERAEKFLKNLGFTQVRVRHHDPLARIEIEKTEINKMLSQNTRNQIVKKFEKLGYRFVCLDLKGYRAGSLNQFPS